MTKLIVKDGMTPAEVEQFKVALSRQIEYMVPLNRQYEIAFSRLRGAKTKAESLRAYNECRAIGELMEMEIPTLENQL